MHRWLPAAVYSLLFVAPAAAEVKLPAFFSEGVVLQRDRDVPVWGTATAGATINVVLDGQTKSVQAAADGRWRVDLAPHQAGGPHVLRVTEGSSPPVEIGDVQFG